MDLNAYQVFLLGVLVGWPLVILAILMGMSRIEAYIDRTAASTPEEAGLEPVAGRPNDREVKIVFGDKVISSPDR